MNSPQDLSKEIQRLGIPSSVVQNAITKLNNPIANTMLRAIGVNKQDMLSGLQSINQPDFSSASTNSSLLQGIDQLK